MPKFDWVCNTLGLVPGPISILSAFSNAGKSFFAANLAICVANSLKLFGFIDIENPGKVMHIDWDQGQKFSKIYYWRLLNGYGIKSFKNINYWRPEWHLDDPESKNNLIKQLSDCKLCIIDCLGSAIPTADINDDRVRSYVDMLNDVSDKTNCAIMLLHHEPKSASSDPLKAVKGNGSIISAAGGSIHLVREPDSQEVTVMLGKKRLVKDVSLKYRLDDCGEMSEKLQMQKGLILNLLKNDAEIKEEKDVNTLPVRILRLVKESPGINATAIRHQIKGTGTKVDKMVKELIASKLIRNEGDKPAKHFITEDGQSRLDYEEVI